MTIAQTIGLSGIITGKTPSPPRLLVYGQEGIGKSTFGASFPAPIFVQTEDGLANIGPARFPLAESFDNVATSLDVLINEKHDFKTLVIDSLDWLERLIWDKVCLDYKVKSIEALGYGKGYVVALNYWREVIDRVERLHDQKMIILLLAHAVSEDYTDAEIANIKRFTPRLHKSARSLVMEYVDAALLATRQFGAAKGEIGNNPRILRTDAAPTQAAKNRYSLPPVVSLDASTLLTLIQQSQSN